MFWVPVDNLPLVLSHMVNRIERETRSLPSGSQAKIRAFYLHSLKVLHTVLIGRRGKPSGTFQIRILTITPIISEPRIFQRLTYKNLHTKYAKLKLSYKTCSFRGTSTKIFSVARKFLSLRVVTKGGFLTCGSTVSENRVLRISSGSKTNEVTKGMTKLYNELLNLHYSLHISYL
jgi:hypothetical protein